ncbi:hypothetical protein SADUNF_Sadunf05G0043600 [Salix dunnii]|uniref:Uncharacterized protein n=1 Tax=Salix dunnii TaxID=1413687 RepID=A0A835N3I5_9ROSI|nr:hypothetical protein SADUNF_Sadunf05G0043600 [Salix dunnii]
MGGFESDGLYDSNWDCCTFSLFWRLTGDRIDSMDKFSRALAGVGWTLFKTRENNTPSDGIGGSKMVYLFRKVDSKPVYVVSLGNGGECRIRELSNCKASLTHVIDASTLRGQMDVHDRNIISMNMAETINRRCWALWNGILKNLIASSLEKFSIALKTTPGSFAKVLNVIRKLKIVHNGVDEIVPWKETSVDMSFICSKEGGGHSGERGNLQWSYKLHDGVEAICS